MIIMDILDNRCRCAACNMQRLKDSESFNNEIKIFEISEEDKQELKKIADHFLNVKTVNEEQVCPGIEACEKTDNACIFYDPCDDCELNGQT